jgi:hypothetical protein
VAALKRQQFKYARCACDDQMTSSDPRRHAPATLRNRQPILAVLQSLLPVSGLVLEIASGSGEHAVFLSRHFPSLTWQPSDFDPDCRASIEAYRLAEKCPNLRPPLDIDVCGVGWPVAEVDAVVCANLLHISPWDCTLGLLAGAGRHLRQGGGLYLYGPFLRDGVTTAPSNLAFDQSLRARNPLWGIRHLAALSQAAETQGLSLEQTTEMPSNNLSLWFVKI